MILAQIRHFNEYFLFPTTQVISKFMLRDLQSHGRLYCLKSSFKPESFISTTSQKTKMALTGVSLKHVVDRLNSFAPQDLAESWDNVGLLIEPATPTQITSILLTNDLTEAVMQEAVEMSTNMIISYHPPIFAPLKSVTSRTWKERIVAKCLENRIALYSPHTCFDAVKGGVNDWLASAFDLEWTEPIIQAYHPGDYSMEITMPIGDGVKASVVNFQTQYEKSLLVASGSRDIDLSITNVNKTDENNVTIQLSCAKSSFPVYEKCYYDCFGTSPGYQLKTSKYEESHVIGHGMGRLCQLRTPLPLNEIVNVVKQHLKLPYLRLAVAVNKNMGSNVSSIAVCAGSGSSVLKKTQADLFLTGEMLHHDVLEAVHQGSHVILTNHSDSERGYLTYFAEVLASKLLEGKVKVTVSKRDCDPLQTV